MGTTSRASALATSVVVASAAAAMSAPPHADAKLARSAEPASVFCVGSAGIAIEVLPLESRCLRRRCPARSRGARPRRGRSTPTDRPSRRASGKIARASFGSRTRSSEAALVLRLIARRGGRRRDVRAWRGEDKGSRSADGGAGGAMPAVELAARTGGHPSPALTCVTVPSCATSTTPWVTVTDVPLGSRRTVKCVPTT